MLEVELKRIADSLEKLVGILGNPQKVSGDAQPVVVRVPAPTKENSTASAPAQTAEAAAVTGEVKTARSRADIKQALDNLGISYNDRLRTENLEAMLIEAEKNGGSAKPVVTPAMTAAPVPSDVQADFFGDQAPAAAAAKPATKEYTVAEGIELAKRLAAKFGPDKTVSIINSYGAVNVTQIAEKGKLQEFCAAVLKKEKDYESNKK